MALPQEAALNTQPSTGTRSARLARVVELLSRPYVVVLLVVGLVISLEITQGEFHLYGDEMRHAVNGVFFRDFLVDLPLKNPLQYTYEYYAKYPALGVPHWPPFFHFVEGVFFLVLGISVWASRLTTLSFALFGVYFWYRIAEQEGPRYRALLSTFIFPLVPYVLLYERATMLEIPLVSLCLGAIYFWRRFLESERAHDLWMVALFSVAGLLTGQKAIFLVFFFGLHFLIERRFRLLRRWDVWAALAVSAALILPWYVLSMRTLTLSYERMVGQAFRHVSSQKHLMIYFDWLPLQLGTLLMCLGLAGFGWALLIAPRRYRFLLLWVFSAYACFTLIQEKDPRHTIIWIPPLVYFALLAVEVLCGHRRWSLAAAGALALYFLVGALRFERPKVVGMDEVARYVLSQPESDIVYYQGYLNGNFIFFVRKYDPERRHMVAREKQVVAMRILEMFGTRKILQTPDEVLNFFQTWGIRYALIEDREFLKGLSPARSLLLSNHFELVRSFPIWSNDVDLGHRQVQLYRYRGEIQRTNQPVVIPMMTIRHDLRADLNRLAGRPWPN